MLVPLHKLPFVENSLEAKYVSFNLPQEMIVKTQQGHEVSPREYYPKYQFDKPEHLDLFLRILRERSLLGKFMPSWVYMGSKKSTLLARRKVFRLWEKQTSAGLDVTLTFLGTDEKQHELNLAFYDPATLSQKTVDIAQRDESGSKGKGKANTITFEFSDRQSDSSLPSFLVSRFLGKSSR